MVPMIDPRLEAALTADPNAPETAGDLGALVNANPTPVAGPAASPRGGATSTNSGLEAALRAEMATGVPGRDKAPEGPLRTIGGWLSVPAESGPVTETSPWFTVSHWHWLAANDLVRQIPADLGPTLPHLFVSESQIIHDLTEWSALDSSGQITDEAAQMFAAVTGDAELTLYGTVLLYAHRREPVELPSELKEFGLEAAVRNVPRVTFSIGVTGQEVVTTLVNNATVVFTRRHRRTEPVPDAASALRDLLDPTGDWQPHPMTGPVTLPIDAVDQLATGADTAGVIDEEPGEDATDEQRAADADRRKKVDKSVRAVMRKARIPTGAAEDVASIATATTDALAQVTLRTRSVDVPRGEPAAVAIAFLRDRGVVVSYPNGSGPNRHITYVSGNQSGIATGIEALRRVVTGT
jgi:hypothetical protein